MAMRICPKMGRKWTFRGVMFTSLLGFLMDQFIAIGPIWASTSSNPKAYSVTAGFWKTLLLAKDHPIGLA